MGRDLAARGQKAPSFTRLLHRVRIESQATWSSLEFKPPLSKCCHPEALKDPGPAISKLCDLGQIMAPCWTRAVKGKAGLVTLPSREFGGLDAVTSRKAPSVASCRNTPPPRT